MKTYIRKYDGAVVKAEEGYTIRLGHCYRVEGLGTFESSHFHDLFERPDLQSQIDAQKSLDPPLIELIVRCQVQEYMLFCEVLKAFKGCEILIPMPPHIEEQFSTTHWDI